MEAKALYYSGNLAGLAAFITENLATQFTLAGATEINISLVEKEGAERVYLFQIK